MTFLCPFIFFISALFKGGGPLRLRNGGGLAAPPGCVSIQDLMPHRRSWKRIPYPLMRVLSPLLHGTRLLLFVASVAGGHIWTTPAGRTWPPALLVLCAGIHRFSGSREGTPYPLTRVLSPFQGDTSGCLGYGTTSGVVAPGVEHAGDRVRLPGP